MRHEPVSEEADTRLHAATQAVNHGKVDAPQQHPDPPSGMETGFWQGHHPGLILLTAVFLSGLALVVTHLMQRESGPTGRPDLFPSNAVVLLLAGLYVLVAVLVTFAWSGTNWDPQRISFPLEWLFGLCFYVLMIGFIVLLLMGALAYGSRELLSLALDPIVQEQVPTTIIFFIVPLVFLRWAIPRLRRPGPYVRSWSPGYWRIVWVAFPLLVALIALRLSEPMLAGIVDYYQGPIVTSTAFAWSMAAWGLFLGWAMLLCYRDGGLLGLSGCILLFGLPAPLLMQSIHESVISLEGVDLSAQLVLWSIPGALFTIYWLLTLPRGGFPSAAKLSRPQRVPRLWVMFFAAALSLCISILSGISNPETASSLFNSGLEAFLFGSTLVLMSASVSMLTAVRYEWGDGKSYTFSLVFGAWASMLLVFAVGTALGVADIVEGVTESVGHVLLIVFAIIVWCVLWLVDGLLFFALFLPNQAARHGLSIPQLRESLASRRSQTQAPEQQLKPAAQEATVSQDSNRPVQPSLNGGVSSATRRRLSPWNPWSLVRLLYWTLLAPKRLLAYRQSYDQAGRRLLSALLVSTLTWLPFVLPVVAMYIGVMPGFDDSWPEQTGLFLCLALLVSWAMTVWAGANANKTLLGWTLVMALLTCGFATGLVFGELEYELLPAMILAGAYVLIEGVIGGIASLLGVELAHHTDFGVDIGLNLLLAVLTVGLVLFPSTDNGAGWIELVAISVSGLLAFGLYTLIRRFLGKALKSGRASKLGWVAMVGLVLALALLIWFSFLGGWEFLSG